MRPNHVTSPLSLAAAFLALSWQGEKFSGADSAAQQLRSPGKRKTRADIGGLNPQFLF